MRSSWAIGLGVAVAVAVVSSANAQVAVPGNPVPVGGSYDSWVTPPGGTSVELNVLADFFGDNSDPLVDRLVDLVGVPFGPNAGPGLKAAADTSIFRPRDPNPAIGGADSVRIEIHGLSLAGTVIVTYNGGQNPEIWGVHVSLSDVTAQTGGVLTATRVDANGGYFDSVLPVTPKFEFTPPGGGAQLVLDAGDGALLSGNGPWANNVGGQSGFFPGYNPQAALVDYWGLMCMIHKVKPCCGPIIVGPLDPVEITER